MDENRGLTMREILFRGKREDNGEWIAESETYIKDGDGTWLCDESNDVVKVLPETVGQYTGLTDKNGVKIFEGDIVRECGGESCQGYYEIDNVLTVKIPDTLINFEMSYDCEYKIIGNIYDNPELLKGGNNNG